MSHDEDPLPDKQEMIAFLHQAVERGITFLDTAEVYGPFINEELVGEALEPFKGEVTIATKFGFKIDEDGVHVPDNRPERIRQVAEESLRRLRVDAIDIFYQHRPDPNVPDTLLPKSPAILSTRTGGYPLNPLTWSQLKMVHYVLRG